MSKFRNKTSTKVPFGNQIVNYKSKSQRWNFHKILQYDRYFYYEYNGL
jgi:hypothetical protein